MPEVGQALRACSDFSPLSKPFGSVTFTWSKFYATNELELGSDHRVVCAFDLRRQSQNKRKKKFAKRRMIRWKMIENDDVEKEDDDDCDDGDDDDDDEDEDEGEDDDDDDEEEEEDLLQDLLRRSPQNFLTGACTCTRSSRFLQAFLGRISAFFSRRTPKKMRIKNCARSCKEPAQSGCTWTSHKRNLTR